MKNNNLLKLYIILEIFWKIYNINIDCWKTYKTMMNGLKLYMKIKFDDFTRLDVYNI